MEESTHVNEKLWLLVEIESYGGINNYTIVDSEEVIGLPSKDNMHTGKTVKIRKGKITVPATIVIISDDKDFLDTELRQLRIMSAMSLANKQSKIENEDNQINSKKRRRTVNDAQFLQPSFYTPQSSWNNKLVDTKDRVLTPTSAIIVQNIKAPPMTFDQQTQTLPHPEPEENRPKFDSSMGEILLNQKLLIDKQNKCLEETKENKENLLNIMEQINSLKNMITDIQMRIMNRDDQQTIILNSTQYPSNNRNNTSYKIDTSDVIIEENIQDEIIYTIEQDESIQPVSSNNNSRLSFNDTTYSNYSSSSEHNISTSKKNKKLNSSQVLANINFNSNNKINCSNIAESIIQEWSSNDIDSLEYVIIGSNNTKIPKHIIRSINWNSHTAATRKLLMALFPREILATHSLTGKPSPAFMDRQKPIKNQLDAKIIADIIQIVTKCCSVPESVVRNAITTKCADENKMNRQRLEKRISTMANKENLKSEIIEQIN